MSASELASERAGRRRSDQRTEFAQENARFQAQPYLILTKVIGWIHLAVDHERLRLVQQAHEKGQDSAR